MPIGVVNEKSPVVRAFLSAGAYTPFTAKTAAQLGLEGNAELNALIESGVVLRRRRSPERLYLPVARWGALVPAWMTAAPLVLIGVTVVIGVILGILAIVEPDLLDRLIAVRRH